MDTKFFTDGKPRLRAILDTIIVFANRSNVVVDSVALIGGWAKAINPNNSRFPNNCAEVFEVELLINESSKRSGDVDLIVFATGFSSSWNRDLDAEFNSTLPPDVKDGRVDILAIAPTALREPGIRMPPNVSSNCNQTAMTTL